MAGETFMMNTVEVLCTIIPVYTAVLGGILVCIGLVECSRSEWAFAVWKKWASHRAYFLHGLVLIAGGFPLTLYKGPLSTAIFIMGLIAVVTGPVVLLYPHKIRSMFESLEQDMGKATIKKVMVTEGVVRISAGVICITGYILGRVYM